MIHNINKYNPVKNGFQTCILSLLFLLGVSGCNYLDIVPDNVPTLEHAFENRQQAEKYLAKCYSYLPVMNPTGNIMIFGADDIWTYEYKNDYPGAFNVARGFQSVTSPQANYWDGSHNNAFDKNYFKAIRDCNTFLEGMKDENGKDRLVVDLDFEEHARWIAEVKFLKAFYNFFLLRMYGPIPIVDKNLPIASTPEEVLVERVPFDSCVNYVAGLLDEAIPNLPLTIDKLITEYGRATSTAALFLKAKLLIYAASPLFNGNPEYADFTSGNGTLLINTEFDPSKWERAADACEAAVDAAELAGFKLYEFTPPLALDLSDTTITQLSIKGSVSAENELNTENIWALSARFGDDGSGHDIQSLNFPVRLTGENKTETVGNFLSATLKTAELFHTKNGVPIDEDIEWDYSKRYDLRKATAQDRFNIKEDYITAYLNFDRENRFYADLGFDGGAFYLQGAGSDKNTYYLEGRVGQKNGKFNTQFYNVTGYWLKKLVNWKYTETQTGREIERYSWPIFNLNDLYLLYAEALNEIDQGDKAITYLDKVRARADLDGVKESWTNYSKQPNKFSSRSGLREIIQREREIELCFEGERIWDIRRWKRAAILLNEPVVGWDIEQSDPEFYYRPRIIYNQSFISPRDYLWPIKEENTIVNPNLVQNPGW